MGTDQIGPTCIAKWHRCTNWGATLRPVTLSLTGYLLPQQLPTITPQHLTSAPTVSNIKPSKSVALSSACLMGTTMLCMQFACLWFELIVSLAGVPLRASTE